MERIPIDSERFARLQSILNRALSAEGSARERILREECAGDDELRESVESLLLAAEEEGDCFCEESIRSSREVIEEMMASGESLADAAHDADFGTDGSPHRIGPYRVVRRIGMGGMGVVFEAEQDAPRRRVALKLLNPLVVTDETRRRFRREAELLGRLQHPHIAQIFESGSYTGRNGEQPFFAMEFVDGTDLRTYTAREHLDARAFLRLFASICDAVHHAHERGIVHRDLKPENILIDANGAPKVLDFGVARATDNRAMLSTMVTDRGELLGTLAYMAPEQLSGTPDAVTPATDVYALGVIAFEILAGRLPFEVSGLPISVAIRKVSEEDPAQLGSVDSVHRGDVEVLVGKAMEREPSRRYPSAAALAADIGRFLDHVPIAARRPSRIYRMRKFARRRRAAVLGVGGTLLALLAGLVVAIVLWTDTRRGRNAIRENLYRAEMAQAADAFENFAGVGRVREILDRWRPAVAGADLRGWEWHFLDAAASSELHDFDAPSPVLSAVWVAETDELITGSFGAIHVWNVWDADRPRLELANTPYLIRPVLPLEGGRRILAGGSDYRHRLVPRVDVWSLETAKLEQTISLDDVDDALGTEIGVASVSPDGNTLAFSDVKGRIQIWSLPGKQLVRTLLAEHGHATAFDPTGRRLSTGGDGGSEIQIWDTATWEREALLANRGFVQDVSWSPDGSRLASTANLEVRVWELEEPSEVLTLSGHRDHVLVVRYSPDGERLATSGADRTIRIWDAQDGRVERELRGHMRNVTTLAWRSDSRHLASASDGDQTIRIWDTDSRLPVRSWPTVADPVSLDSVLWARLSWSADASRILTFYEGTTRVWSADRGELIESISGRAVESPDGASLAIRRADTLTIRSTAPGIETITRPVNGLSASTLSWSPSGDRLLVSVGAETSLGILSLTHMTDRNPSGDEASVPDVFHSGDDQSIDAVWSPSGDVLACYDMTALRVVDAQSRTVELETKTRDRILAIAFDSDGSRLATAERGNDLPIRIWNRADLSEIRVLRGHTFDVASLDFHPDGKRLASGGRDGTVRIWDIDAGALVVTLRHEPAVVAIAWSPDGQQLAALDSDLELKIWDATPGHASAK